MAKEAVVSSEIVIHKRSGLQQRPTAKSYKRRIYNKLMQKSGRTRIILPMEGHNPAPLNVVEKSVSIIGKTRYNVQIEEPLYLDNVNKPINHSKNVVELALALIEEAQEIPEETRRIVVQSIRARYDSLGNRKLALAQDRDHTHPQNEVKWPKETYSEARKRRGVNIVEFLEDPNGWLPLIRAGLVTRPVLRFHDISAEHALANFQRGGRKLPEHLHIPTKSETIDREIESGGSILEGAARLYQVVRYRQKARSASPT